MHTKTISEIRQQLSTKKISSVELTKHLIDRINKFNPKLNAFISVTEEQALERAKLADLQISKGEQKILTGIPIAHKDIFCTKGIKTTCGSKMLDNFISPYDATVVDKLNNSGAVMLGKLNMDEFAMGSSNENSFYGSVKNPWNLECVPGGSSGGSAAAVAAGLAFGVTGTDTGGSIRQPAAFCGITGLKPTYGLVSRYGMIAFASSLDQAGPMAKTAEDCAILLQEMSGFDPKDSTSLEQQIPDFSKTLNDDIKGLKIGLPKEFFSKDLDSAIADKIKECVKELEKLGATVKEISLPNTHLSIPAYYIIAPAEASSNLARYDGVRFGYRCDNPKDLQDLYKRTRTEGFGIEVKRRILVGTFVLSAGFYDAYYIKAQKIRRLIANDFVEAFKEVDVIMGPTTPTPAFKLDSKKDPVSMYLNDMYTSSVNLAGLPGISFPCGVVNGLPVGAQIIGNYMNEAKILNIAHKYQQVSDWHKQTPKEV